MAAAADDAVPPAAGAVLGSRALLACVLSWADAPTLASAAAVAALWRSGAREAARLALARRDPALAEGVALFDAAYRLPGAAWLAALRCSAPGAAAPGALRFGSAGARDPLADVPLLLTVVDARGGLLFSACASLELCPTCPNVHLVDATTANLLPPAARAAVTPGAHARHSCTSRPVARV